MGTFRETVRVWITQVPNGATLTLTTVAARILFIPQGSPTIPGLTRLAPPLPPSTIIPNLSTLAITTMSANQFILDWLDTFQLIRPAAIITSPLLDTTTSTPTNHQEHSSPNLLFRNPVNN